MTTSPAAARIIQGSFAEATVPAEAIRKAQSVECPMADYLDMKTTIRVWSTRSMQQLLDSTVNEILLIAVVFMNFSLLTLASSLRRSRLPLCSGKLTLAVCATPDSVPPILLLLCL